MQEKIKHIKVNEIEYPLVFNLNVMEKIQEKYESVEKWGELTDGYAYDENGKRIPKLDDKGNLITKKVKNEKGEEIEIEVFKTQEIDVKALKFGITEMINEGIDIENETAENKRELVTDKKVGRIIMELGIEKIANKVQDTVIESTKIEDNSKNA